MTDAVLARVRNLVQMLVSAFATWLLTLGIELSDEFIHELTLMIYGLVNIGYYVIFSYLIERGWLPSWVLGPGSNPKYNTEIPPSGS